METRLLTVALDTVTESRTRPLYAARLIDPATMREIATSELGAYEGHHDAIRAMLDQARERRALAQ